MVYVFLTNVADELHPDSVTPGGGCREGEQILGAFPEAKPPPAPPHTFSAYSDTICLISAEQSPTIWPTELAVRRLCNHREGVFSRPCLVSHRTGKPECSEYHSKLGNNIPLGGNYVSVNKEGRKQALGQIGSHLSIS